EQIAEQSERDLKDNPRALSALGRALELRPDESRLAEEVERVARAAGKDTEAGEIFAAVLAAGPPAEVQRDLGLRVARLWERLGDLKRAEAGFQSVLDGGAGGQADALESLERIYRVRGD